MKPLIAIPRWKAPTWERTGCYLDSLEMAGARCQLAEEFRRQRFGGVERWARESGVTLPDDL